MLNSAGMVTAITEKAEKKKMAVPGSLSTASPQITTANSRYSASGTSTTGAASAGLRNRRMNSKRISVRYAASARRGVSRPASASRVFRARAFMQPPW